MTPSIASHHLGMQPTARSVSYEVLHDAVKRRRDVNYPRQGEIRAYAFRVANIGTLTPRDMTGVVAAFDASLDELATRRPARGSRAGRA